MAQQCKPAVFGLMLTIAATAAACPAGWTPSPNASWANQCFGVPASRSSSLRSCVELCGAEGGVPACVASAEENSFAAELLGDDSAWLGLYQNDTASNPNYQNGVDEGWGRCVALEAPSFSSWRARQPRDHWLATEDCAVMDGLYGTWFSRSCASIDLGWITDLSFRCLCAGPANASAAFPDDLEALEAAVEAALEELRANVAVVYPIATLIALLPALLLGRRLRSGGAAAGDGDGAPLPSAAHRPRAHRLPSARHAGSGAADKATASTLRADGRSAAQRRLHVSGAMLQLGWALCVFGAIPMIMFMTGAGDRRIDAIVGPTGYWFLMYPPGFCVLLLALLPTDARAIRTVCAVWFAFFLPAGLYSLPMLLRYAMSWPLPFLVLLFALAVLSLATAAALAPTLHCGGCTRLPVMQPRQALRRLWCTARLCMGSIGVLLIGSMSALMATHPFFASDPNSPANIAVGALFLACAVLATPRNRGRLHRQLGRLGGRGSEEEEAAAITALVAGADPDKALADAAELFCCLPASSLTADDLAGSGLKGESVSSDEAVGTSAEELAKKTVKATHGEVTCFFSHSWRDEKEAPGAKFEALQLWARRHKEKTGEEATLWLVRARPLRRLPAARLTSSAAPRAGQGVHRPDRPSKKAKGDQLPAHLPRGLPDAAHRGGPYLLLAAVVRDGDLHLHAHGRLTRADRGQNAHAQGPHGPRRGEEGAQEAVCQV